MTCYWPSIHYLLLPSIHDLLLPGIQVLLLQILDSLIAEDDSVPNVWYMLAMCLIGGGEVEAAEEALQQGQLLLKKTADADDLAKEFSELKVLPQSRD